MRRRLIVLLVAFGLWLVALPAGAQQKSTVQVLAIASEDAFEQAQALTISLKRAVTRAEGWALAKGDFSLEVMTAALGCPLPPDPACQKKIANKVGTDRYVWGTISKSGKKEVTAVLRLYEGGAHKRDTQVKYASNLTDPSDDALLTIAADAFARLTGEATGVLVVSAGNVTGKVFVDGKEAGTITDGRTELSLASGEHKIVVKADGYNDAIGTATVRAGSSSEITLTPTAASSATKSGTDTAKDTGAKPGNTKKLLGYGGLALGGVLVVAGGYFWFRSFQTMNDDGYEDYKRTVPKSEDPCEYAESAERDDIVELCDKNKSYKTLAYILTPIGVVIGGVGAYFLMTSDEKPRAAKKAAPPRIQPFIGLGPKGGSVLVNVSF